MIFRLFSAFFLFVIALVGTVAGNAICMALDKGYRKRYSTPDTGDLIVTGVLSNSIIAALIALLSGTRYVTAFVGGVVLTAILGDRLDREPFEWTLCETEEQSEIARSETFPTNGVNPPESASP